MLMLVLIVCPAVGAPLPRRSSALWSCARGPKQASKQAGDDTKRPALQYLTLPYPAMLTSPRACLHAYMRAPRGLGTCFLAGTPDART